MGKSRMSRLIDKAYDRFMIWYRLNSSKVARIGPSENEKMMMFFAIEETTKEQQRKFHSMLNKIKKNPRIITEGFIQELVQKGEPIELSYTGEWIPVEEVEAILLERKDKA